MRGSGIGLAVVDEIVTALDGSVDIQSEVGRGTTVTVRLPLYKRPAPSGAPPRRHGGGLKRFPGVAGLPARRERCPAFGPGADNLLMHRPQKGNPIEQQK